MANAVTDVTGRKPELSTTGGTSDARFIKDYCPVVEFGLVGQTMHEVDERVPIADLRALTTIYRKILDSISARSQASYPPLEGRVGTARATRDATGVRSSAEITSPRRFARDPRSGEGSRILNVAQ